MGVLRMRVALTGLWETENPEANEIDKFIEMQKLIFGVNKPS